MNKFKIKFNIQASNLKLFVPIPNEKEKISHVGYGF